MLVGQTIGSGSYRFEIEQELGSGAMGTVYRAKFHRDGKTHPVALKIVALGLLGNEGAMARFEREANILKQLKHEHIVRLYATGAYRKTPFIAMEFIDGEALDRVLARRGRLTWEEVVAYGKQLCKALQYAHEKGIIHRDLKPSNLMINQDGILKLTDFGIAKDTDVTALTGHNSTIGTAAYMSPEQCKGDKNLSNKSDLYSLGIVFYELLTGKKPFYADTTVDMFLKHVNEPAPRIGKQVNELPAKLETLVLQLMEKEKDERPTDAAWVLRMLGEIEEDAYTRKSAGLAAATSKRQNRPRNLDGSKLDETDRDAARALRGKKKKKRKDADVPLLERTWVKATGLILALLFILGGAYYALRPASPERLAAAIESADSPEARVEAAEKYLDRYGQKPGELTDRAAAAFRDGHVALREKQFATRLRTKMMKPFENDDPDAYKVAWEAIEFEEKGSLALAEQQWRRVKEKFPEEGKLPFALKEDVLAKARWGWLADKRLADIHTARKDLGEVLKAIEDTRRNDLAFNVDPASPRGLTIRGLRLEDFGGKPGDKVKAAAVWQSLAELTEKDPAAHSWHLLALQQLAKSTTGTTPENAEAERIKLVEKELTNATAKSTAAKEGDPDVNRKRKEVRVICREIIDLYEDELTEKIKDAVKKARDLSATVQNR
jgi:serine/threonine protein kinase